MGFQEVAAKLDSYKQEVIDLQKAIVAIPALSPTYDPPPEHCGEMKKVEFLETYLKQRGIEEFVRIDAPDNRVPAGVRPNLVARLPGLDRSRTVWVMAHTDVVPPGDLSKWNGDPWKVQVEGDKIVGRGVEDNHQGLVAGTMAALALIETDTTPKYDLALLFVADEECGSEYGIQYVLENGSPFIKEDLIVVPDGGAADGSEIEIAEKGIAWIKFRIEGVQAHASTPDRGKNAMRAGAHLIVALDALHEVFGNRNPVFDPPTSTFEPTKKEANVPNVNTIPGDDVFFLDCRVLPEYSIDEVEAEVQRIVDEVAESQGVTINYSFEQREEASPATPEDAPVVGLLKDAVKEVYGIDAKRIGIGGGTVAAYLRREELACVVWSKMDETMHGPNENARISNIIGDAKVIARLALG